MKNNIFFSLKWKVSILIASVFLLAYSLFSYLFYLDKNKDYLKSRQTIEERYKHVAEALTKDSFLELAQFAELLSLIVSPKGGEPVIRIKEMLDKNWQQWQFIWGLGGVVFFDQNATLLYSWGDQLINAQLAAQKAIKQEQPIYQINCADICYQLVMVPVLENSKQIGVFGISRTLADIIIKYNQVMEGDVGILVREKSIQISKWPYRISAITNVGYNKELVSYLTKNFLFDQFVGQRKVINYKQQFIEIIIFPIKTDMTNGQAYYIIINNITDDKNSMLESVKTLWVYGVVSLLFALILFLLVLFFSLRRVVIFSSALPLLAEKKFDKFRAMLKPKEKSLLGYDELDILNNTAMGLAAQLEDLETDTKYNIFQLIEQGQELTLEKEFIQQLINVAPILILTQDTNGLILSINQFGKNILEKEEGLIIGNVFDNIIPEAEIDHLLKLKELRSAKSQNNLEIDGVLFTPSIEKNHISWIHTVIKSTSNKNSFLILTIGVDISDRKKSEKKIVDIATHDQLTKLSNRHFFQLQLNKELAVAKRYGSQLALYYIDLDGFKLINDTYGHKIGDKLLAIAAKALQGVVRKTDTLSRIGGDEFTLIMPICSIQSIENVAFKINQRLEALEFIAGEKHCKVSASIGISIYPLHGLDVHELLSNADLAMYQAKECGPGQYRIYSTDFH